MPYDIFLATGGNLGWVSVRGPEKGNVNTIRGTLGWVSSDGTVNSDRGSVGWISSDGRVTRRGEAAGWVGADGSINAGSGRVGRVTDDKMVQAELSAQLAAGAALVFWDELHRIHTGSNWSPFR